MSKPVALLCAVFLLGGCTIFSPLDRLHPKVPHEIPDKRLNISIAVVGPLDIYSSCIDNGLSPFLSILGAPLLGCTNLHYPDNKGVHRCVVYLAFDWEWTREHEVRHCKGYID